MKSLFLLIFPFLFLSCSGSSEENSKKPDTTEQATDPAASIARYFYQLPSLPLPLVFDESYFRSINTTSFTPMPDALQAQLLQERDEDAEYYFVSRYAINDAVQALLIFESKLDTNFNAEERFFLNTYNQDTLINSIVFAASVSDEDHFKTLGQIGKDTLIATARYSYKWRDGKWQKVEQPVKIATYRIREDGTIDPVNTEVHIDDNEEVQIFS